jgi:hypothetical protein
MPDIEDSRRPMAGKGFILSLGVRLLVRRRKLRSGKRI